MNLCVHQQPTYPLYHSEYANCANIVSVEADFQKGDDSWVRGQLEDLARAVSIENLEPEASGKVYFNIIDFVRGTGVYERFLELSREYGPMVERAILNSMMRYTCRDLKPGEEDFLLQRLSSGNLGTQEIAIGVLYAWGGFSNIDKLENITIEDRFLQEDLLEYINEQRTT